MKRTLLRASSVLLAATIVLLVASFRPITPNPSSAPEASTELERIYAPFDTIETDLNDYRWPLPDGFLTTSVFGDYRSTHFHGGIDISTQGREGIPVRAMRSGWVSMLRISPHGYGNVVELKHADGFTTWHAHLKGFAPNLDSLIRPRLQRSGGVSAEIKLDSGQVMVDAGELIAFTGSTGAGGPHHHFEIRDAQQNPVDPMLVPSFEARVADRIAPTIEELGIVPLSGGTLVQGNVRPAYLRPGQTRSGVATIGQRLRLTGDAGLTVRVRDAVGPRAFRNRNVSLELFVDGVSHFSSRTARLPADDSKQIAVHYDWTAQSAGHPYHQKLFIEEGNRLPFYSRSPYGTGILRSSELTEGPHTLEIVARDLNNNETRLRAEVVVNHPPVVRAERSGRDLVITSGADVGVERILVGTSTNGIEVTPWRSIAVGDGSTSGPWTINPLPTAPFIRVAAVNRFGTVSDPVWIASTPSASGRLDVSTEIVRDMAIVTVRASQPLSAAPRVRIMADANLPEPVVRSLSARQYVASVGLRPDLGRSFTVEAVAEGAKGSTIRGTDEVTLAPVTPSAGGLAELPDGSFRVTFGPRGVLSDMYVQLEPSGNGVRVLPHDRVLDEGAVVEMEVPADLLSRKAGLFVLSGGDEQLLDWRPAFGDRHLRGRVTRFLGTFRVLEDEDPPHFDRAYLSFRSKTLTLEVRIRDHRSGLSTSSLRVTVDGEPVPATFDSDRRRLSVNERLDVPPGRHRVEIRASDRMANERIWTGSFTTR